MASLIKQDGKYYLQFYSAERHPKQKKVALKASRKRPAKRKQRELEDAYVEGAFDPWTDDPFTYDEPDLERVTLGEAQERFLSRKRKDGRAKSTICTYREIVSLLAGKVGEDTPLDTLTERDLRAFIRDPLLAKATQHKRYGHLRTFFRWCIKERLLKESPLEDVAKPKKPEKLPKAITEEELQKVCCALWQDYKEKRRKNQVRKGQMVWRIPLFRFAFYTGMRGSELGRLRWRHIDYDRGLIYIYKQKNRKEQTIPLNRKAKATLEDVREGDPEDYVFRPPSFESKERGARYFRERAEPSAPCAMASARDWRKRESRFTSSRKPPAMPT